MGRRRRESASSLDLLLDTICNTFGGVVFMAILVVVLLRMTSETHGDAPPDAERQEALAALEARREEAAARLATLRQAADQQAKLLAQVTKPENQPALAKLDETKRQRDKLNQERLNRLGEISQAQIEINRVATEMATLDASLKVLPDKVAKLESALANEVAARSQAARLPMQRDTDKDEAPLLVREGRLHTVYLFGDDGTVVFNSAECEEHKGQVREVTTRPGSGLKLDDSDAVRREIEVRLANLEADSFYLAIFVWPDSFAEFRKLKEVIVDRRFEYRLVPMRADGKVVMGAASQAPAKVQ